jgi:DNA helicase II / ATP-dependent DNA helicase PcrA
MDLLLEGLNPAQREAAMTTSGPLLLLAGAGSGKTKTLTHRIAYLIAHEGIDPHQILAVTFTNKAAKEMRHRLATLVGANSQSRSFMPWMGTFHSICVRLLRQDGIAIGIGANFVIYDEDDRQGLIKQAMKTLAVTDTQLKPRSVSARISTAKSELMTPVEMMEQARYPNEKIIAQIYTEYERLRRAAGALDFDDLLTETVRLFREHPEIVKRWQTQFRHILIDEYQDTNAAQYAIVRALVNEQKNICVVGDDWQCLLADSMIATDAGPRPVQSIRRGQTILAASGYGNTNNAVVSAKKSFRYDGDSIIIETKGGSTLRCTPNHIVFARFEPTDQYFVYLMYRSDKGYRIGIAKGTRFDGRVDTVGLRVRANQERAERMWVLGVHDSRADTQYEEATLSYKYGIPQTLFHAHSNRSLTMTQQQIDELYQSIDTETRAATLMHEKGILFEYPHFLPEATTRGQTARVNINLVLFGDKRQTTASPWSASRLSATTTRPESLSAFTRRGYSVRAAKNGTYRSEIHNLDYGKLEQLATAIANDTSANLARYSYLTDQKFLQLPASQLHVGMSVAVQQNSRIIKDTITTVTHTPYHGLVYDLDIDNVHNYIADGIVVHNSIYSWRGADFKNILNFERDFPGAKVVKLEQNYRSTKAILDAAHQVITKNVDRTDKTLWTDGPAGAPVQVTATNDEGEEAFAVASRIATQVSIGARDYGDFAVLYRMNSQTYPLERAFLLQRIPYQIIGGVRFYDRREVKDVIAYLRLIFQPNDRMSFSRIVNIPTRGIGATSLEKFLLWQSASELDIITALEQVQQATGLTSRARTALLRLGTTLRALSKQVETSGPSQLIEQLVRAVGYREFLLDGTPQAEEREANLGALISDASSFAALPDFLEEVGLMSSVDSATDQQKVSLMTLHAAKGLEFPVVCMIGMEEGVFPHARVYEAGPAELEEERRLCYVGMTRAREELHLSYAQSRLQFGNRSYNMPSRFLTDIGDQLAMVPTTDLWRREADTTGVDEIVEFDIGDIVRSAQFGRGEVVDIDGLAVAVRFESGTTKKLNVQYARLEKIPF